jgi:PKD domain
MQRSFRKGFVRTVLVVAVAVLAVAVLPGVAAAASQPVNLTFSGSHSKTDILSAIAVCDECAPDLFFDDPTDFLQTWGFGASGQIQAQASWNASATVDATYTQTKLRHGQTLDLSDTLTPGTITVNYSAVGTLGLFGTPQTGNLSCAQAAVSNAGCNGWVPTTSTLMFGPINESDTIPCTMPLPGDSPVDCSKTHTIKLWNADLFDFVSVEVDLILDETVHVTGAGVTSVRIAVVSGGQPIANHTVDFSGSSPSTVADPITIGCDQPVGNDLLYSLTSNAYNAEPATYTGDVKLRVAASAFGIGGDYTSPALVSSSGADLGPIAMTAPDQQVDLGPVLANNIAPSVDAGGPYSGVEGTPVAFDGSGSTSACGLDSLTFVWSFSDGGVAYGVSPQHTFHGPGVYSGLLTATDGDGNVATKTFSVTIGNLSPVVHSGPDMGSEWGVPVTLNGNAVDPGSDEQPFLTYSWSFGDGSPSASGGAGVNHSYGAPGVYSAVFTACDPYALCSSSTTHVTVVKRATTLTYTGPNTANSSKTVALSATLVDDLGQPVAGRVVQLTLGTQSITATTNSFGVAAATIKLSQKHGSYSVAAAYGGDGKYIASNDSRVFVIGS